MKVASDPLENIWSSLVSDRPPCFCKNSSKVIVVYYLSLKSEMLRDDIGIPGDHLRYPRKPLGIIIVVCEGNELSVWIYI